MGERSARACCIETAEWPGVWNDRLLTRSVLLLIEEQISDTASRTGSASQGRTGLRAGKPEEAVGVTGDGSCCWKSFVSCLACAGGVESTALSRPRRLRRASTAGELGGVSVCPQSIRVETGRRAVCCCSALGLVSGAREEGKQGEIAPHRRK